jgi:hypothetical protein
MNVSFDVQTDHSLKNMAWAGATKIAANSSGILFAQDGS